jgi:hypothetical protein
MKLERWALIAEVASGIAVVITLAFLVAGIRDNTNATRAAVYQDLMGELNQLNLAFANDSELSKLWAEHYDTPDWSLDGLAEDQANRLVLFNRVMFRIYDAAYQSYNSGTLAESQFLRFKRNLCDNVRISDLWSETTVALSDDFVEFAETNC